MYHTKYNSEIRNWFA